MRGIVKWFSPGKGYGFISKEDGSGDVFCHFSGIKGEGYRNLTEGETVTFETEESNRGPRAIDVVVVRTVDGEEIPPQEQVG